MKKPPQTHHFLPPPLHNPYNHHHSNYENTLIDEVLYLHSLWRRGPPNPSPYPYPYLKPTHTTHFKKKTSDKPWPVPKPSPSQPGPGWPSFPAHNKPITRPATGPERARALGLRIQLDGVESCCGLFRGGENEDDDDDVEEEEEEEDDGDDEEELDFFENLFEEEKELREFYVRNCENGEFYCLVCGVIGKRKKNINLGRKYKNCVALVQHSMSVSKTKKRKAHRVYGNIVCKVLGWDVNRLPSMSNFVEVGEPSSLSLKDEVKNHTDEDSTVVEMEINAVLTTPSQSEIETIADSLEKGTVPSTNAGCIAIELTHTGGEVKNQNDEDNTAVEMVEDAANASQSHVEPEGILNAFEKDSVASTDVGRLASALTQSESERKDVGNGCKMDNKDTKNDTVCSNYENVMPERKNDPELNPEVGVKKVGEEFSVLGSEQVECESSVSGSDPFEQLQCLPGEFKIPE